MEVNNMCSFKYNEKISMLQELERKHAKEKEETTKMVFKLLREGLISIEEAEKRLGIDSEKINEQQKALASKKRL